MSTSIDPQILEKAKLWLDDSFDQKTRSDVQRMINSAPDELVESFYRDLEFGTGGLRGIMGSGTNRMNIYTVGMATQGLANYLKKVYGSKPISAAIAYDCRNNNSTFANVTADVLSANGIKVYIFDALRPTPELSFAVRKLGCQSGIVITASHNPKEYNGYKVYWEDGGQLINPHDVNVIEQVRMIKSVKEVNFKRNDALIHMIGDDIDKLYLREIKKLSLNPEAVSKQKGLKIVYTPIHGTGVELVPKALRDFGFENIINIPEQDVVDGNFPTVHSPNPEEPAALAMALEKAEKTGADIVMATDPDSDRVGIAVRNLEGEFVLLNGNQTAALLIHYILEQWKKQGKFKGNEYIVKTIVTTELLKDMADKYGVDCHDVLTGFKYIADIIRRKEASETFIGGGEESYGYLVGDFVRDKDAVISCCMIAETAAWAKVNGRSMYEQLIGIYKEFGIYKEKLVSLVKKGKEGSEAIQKIMDGYRNSPAEKINGSKVIRIIDYKSGKARNTISGEESNTGLPSSNVLQFFLEDGSKITVRPSGTEPKIKYYFGCRQKEISNSGFEKSNAELDEKINGIISDLGLDK